MAKLGAHVARAGRGLKKLFAIQLMPLAMGTVPLHATFQKTEIGGLSALAWTGDRLLLLSDDKGEGGGPTRFYEATLEITGKKATLDFTAVRAITGLPARKGKKEAYLDPEGLARDPSGDLYLSSETNTRKSPREPNRLLHLKPTGEFVREIELPEDVQPEPNGLQHKGAFNNAGPEGLSLDPKGVALWMGFEQSLMQEREDRTVRLDRFRRDGKGEFAFESTHRYGLDHRAEGAKELFFRLSEVLALDEDHLLVLEPSVTLEGFHPGFGGHIYLADCRLKTCVKTLVFDLEKDFGDLRGKTRLPNYEGLAFGPVLKDGRRTVLMVNDNDFKRGPSELIVFTLKETP